MPKINKTGFFMAYAKIQEIVTPPKKNVQPAPILESLRLKNSETSVLVEGLVPTPDEPVLYTHAGKTIKVTILQLDNGSYFAKLHPAPLAGIADKERFIKQAVLFALKEKNIAVKFEDIAVGGVIGGEGRKAVIYSLFGEPPRSEHMYAVFKLPGEARVHIEDPRMGVLTFNDKLQSKLDDQICCFAATALFYFGYKAFSEHEQMQYSSSTMFEMIHASHELRKKMRELENKVGYARETKEEAMASFIKEMQAFDNPLDFVPYGVNPP